MKIATQILKLLGETSTHDYSQNMGRKLEFCYDVYF
jgi:hypothetical protein